VDIIIEEEFILDKKHTIVKNNEEEFEFVKEFIRKFESINMVNITNKISLKCIVQKYADIVESTWISHS